MLYFDHNATTPLLPEVREAMAPYLAEEWGNPSSSYRFGSQLKAKLEEAREHVAALISARFPREIVFTSGGTESNNAALHAALLSRPGKRHLVTSQVEHSSVLSYCRFLEKHHGYHVTYLPVDREGILVLTDVENALTDNTAIVSLMWANNETGVLFPVEKVATLCHDRGILFHCDAVQAAGKRPIDVQAVPFDYVSLTGHKLGAPKGIGALYVNRRSPFVSFVHGGHQERSRRGGTENVASIVGLGIATALARQKLPADDATVRPLRDALESELLADSSDPSYAIAAMKPGTAARQSVRFSLGPDTTASDIQRAVDLIREPARSLAFTA